MKDNKRNAIQSRLNAVQSAVKALLAEAGDDATFAFAPPLYGHGVRAELHADGDVFRCPLPLGTITTGFRASKDEGWPEWEAIYARETAP